VTVFGWLVIGLLGSIAWPLNVPLMALAYKVRNGQQPIPFEPKEYWLRSTFAALGLAVLGWIFLPLYLVLFSLAGVPELIGVIVLSIVYLPLALVFLHWMMAFDELVETIGLLVVYLLLPGLPLVLLGLIFGLARKVGQYVSAG
jgi:hypothetical protein